MLFTVFKVHFLANFLDGNFSKQIQCFQKKFKSHGFITEEAGAVKSTERRGKLTEHLQEARLFTASLLLKFENEVRGTNGSTVVPRLSPPGLLEAWKIVVKLWRDFSNYCPNALMYIKKLHQNAVIQTHISFKVSNI